MYVHIYIGCIIILKIITYVLMDLMDKFTPMRRLMIR